MLRGFSDARHHTVKVCRKRLLIESFLKLGVVSRKVQIMQPSCASCHVMVEVNTNKNEANFKKLCLVLSTLAATKTCTHPVIFLAKGWQGHLKFRFILHIFNALHLGKSWMMGNAHIPLLPSLEGRLVCFRLPSVIHIGDGKDSTQIRLWHIPQYQVGMLFWMPEEVVCVYRKVKALHYAVDTTTQLCRSDKQWLLLLMDVTKPGLTEKFKFNK